MTHRCAVCRERFSTHTDWYVHAVLLHGTDTTWGYQDCPTQSSMCAGIQHARRLPTEGEPPKRRIAAPAPVTTRDGTTYIPLRLPDV